MSNLMLRLGLMLLCLSLFSGCTAKPETVIVEKTITQTVLPPASLMRPCPLPEPSGPLATNRDIDRYMKQLYLVIALCDYDKTLLRDWRTARGGQDGRTE